MKCPNCNSENIRKIGKTVAGSQRLQCKDCGRNFCESYTKRGRKNKQPKCLICDRISVDSGYCAAHHPNVESLNVCKSCNQRLVHSKGLCSSCYPIYWRKTKGL